jgi:hypothetical protein
MQYSLAHQLGKRSGALDPDAKAYIAAVETADGQALESGVRKAINNFVVGCKGDGIWDAIKASCILAGARTLSGALVPLVGTAPTNNNFVSGDYNRETGLVGDGSTKYLDSNRNNNTDPQDDNHNALWVTAFNGVSISVMGAADPFNESGANNMGIDVSGNAFSRCRTATGTVLSGSGNGLIGFSRSASGSYVIRSQSANNTISQTSQTPSNRNVFVFGRAATALAPSRASFYSIGEALDLEALDTRVSTLMTDIAAAIP